MDMCQVWIFQVLGSWGYVFSHLLCDERITMGHDLAKKLSGDSG